MDVAGEGRKRPHINFYTAVVDGNIRYQDYVVPYIISALYHNENSTAEILVSDVSAFTSVYRDVLKILDQNFEGRYRIRSIPGYVTDILPNSVRFLTVPETMAAYTYIGDVDVLILDPHIAEWHATYMQENGLPYSNNQRKGQEMLTGLHCVHSDRYYSKIDAANLNIFVQSLKKQNLAYRHHDEKLLYSIVKHCVGKLPTDYYSYATRPVHGIHMSPNREPLGQPGWEITPLNAVRYLEFRESELWKSALPVFSEAYREQINRIDAVVEPILQYCKGTRAG